jgi:putative membrane protein
MTQQQWMAEAEHPNPQASEPAAGPTGEASDGTASAESVSVGELALRGGFGGVLMGLANLVPGISGGTMLLATGIYPRFIDALGEISRLRFRLPGLVTIGSVVVAALVAIIALAGPVKELVVTYRWIMYSLFIGLTLGGVPVLWRLIGERAWSMWLGAAAGFAGMTVLAVAQTTGGGAAASQSGFLWMLLAGIAAASAMILPGVSGGYLLLVLGVYVPLLGAIDQFKTAASGADLATLWSVGWQVVLPVGLGVIIGVGGVSNGLRWLLQRWEKPTLGVLLGLLLGAVVGLYPFQQTVAPEPGDTIKGQTVVQTESGGLALAGDSTGRRALKPEAYPTTFFTPSVSQVAGALGLVVVGFAVTWGIDALGRARRWRKPETGGTG